MAPSDADVVVRTSFPEWLKNASPNWVYDGGRTISIRGYDSGANPWLKLGWSPDSQYIVFDYSEYGKFVIAASGGEVFVSSSRQWSDLTHTIFGPIAAYVLRLRGVVSLHAAAVGDGKGAILFAGASGAGKSTVAAFLNKSGFDVLCDDLSVLDLSGSDIRVWRGRSLIKLWPASVSSLGIAYQGLAKVVSTHEKRLVWGGQAEGGKGAAKSLRVKGVCFLRRHRGKEMRLHECPSIEACRRFLSHTSTYYLTGEGERGHRAKELFAFGRMDQRKLFWFLDLPDGLDNYARVCNDVARVLFALD